MKNEIFGKMMADINLDESTKERILFNVEENLKKHRQKSKKMLCGGIVILALFTVSIPSIAKVILEVSNRMNEMEQPERDYYNTLIQESGKEAFSFSRELTEDENHRMEELTEQYISGNRYPEKSVKIFEDTQKTDASIYYDKEKSLIMLPDTELNDEEILQLLDFYAKSDFSLRKNAGKIEEKTKPVIQRSDEKMISDYAGAFFDETVEDSQLELERELDNGNLIFTLSISSETTGFDKWSIQADKQTMHPIVIEAIDNDSKISKMNNLREEIIETDEWVLKYRDLFEEGKKYLSRLGYHTEDLEGAGLIYYGESDTNLAKIIRFYYNSREGESYQINFIIETESVCIMRVIQEDYEAFIKKERLRAEKHTKENELLKYKYFLLNESK